MLIDDVQERRRSVDDAVREVLDNAARRARFFSGPAAWLEEHGLGRTGLIDAYAQALAHEFDAASPAHAVPTWLVGDAARSGVPGADARRADEVRMAAAVVAAGAAVVSAVAAVVTAVVAVTNAMGASGTPVPPKKGPPPNPQ